jgi:hypothetical protein
VSQTQTLRHSPCFMHLHRPRMCNQHCNQSINHMLTLITRSSPLTLGRTCTCSHLGTPWSVYGCAPSNGATDSTMPACGRLGEGSASTAKGRDRSRLAWLAAAAADASGSAALLLLLLGPAWMAASCLLERPATAAAGQQQQHSNSLWQCTLHTSTGTEKPHAVLHMSM